MWCPARRWWCEPRAPAAAPSCAAARRPSYRTAPLQFRIRIAQLRQIGRMRPRVQLRQQCIVQLFVFQLRHLVSRVVHIAEHDGFGGTDLLARRLDLAIPDETPFVDRADLRLADPLHAIRALLHYPAAP